MQKRRGQVRQPAVSTQVDRWSWKMADCFTLLKRITRLKIVNSAIRSKDQRPYLDRYSRRVHATLTKPAWDTLSQNCHCEFCCGVHLKCKNNPFIPDENGRSVGIGSWPFPLISNQKVQMRQQCSRYATCKIAKPRHGGSWVEPLPTTRKTYCAGTSIQRPGSISQATDERLFLSAGLVNAPSIPYKLKYSDNIKTETRETAT